MDRNLEMGDTFTICGKFKRRTFWQWLTRQPKQLEVFSVSSFSGSDHTRDGYLRKLEENWKEFGKHNP